MVITMSYDDRFGRSSSAIWSPNKRINPVLAVLSTNHRKKLNITENSAGTMSQIYVCNLGRQQMEHGFTAYDFVHKCLNLAISLCLVFLVSWMKLILSECWAAENALNRKHVTPEVHSTGNKYLLRLTQFRSCQELWRVPSHWHFVWW